MSAVPYRDEHGTALPPAREARDEDRIPRASTFDRLVESTLAIVESNAALTKSVGRLVRLSWAIISMNVILLSAVAALLAWTTMFLSRPDPSLLHERDQRRAATERRGDPSLVHAEGN